MIQEVDSRRYSVVAKKKKAESFSTGYWLPAAIYSFL
jgi:hypothetical protein